MLHFGSRERDISHALPEGCWRKLLDTTDALPQKLPAGRASALSLLPGAVVVYARAKSEPGELE